MGTDKTQSNDRAWHLCPVLNGKGSELLCVCVVTSLKEETNTNLHLSDSKCTGYGIVMYLTWLMSNYNLKTSYFNIQGFGFAISHIHLFILSFACSTSVYCMLKIYKEVCLNFPSMPSRRHSTSTNVHCINEK